jgi:hypothetical protein
VVVRADCRNMHDDELVISNGYRKGQTILAVLAALPAAALWLNNDKAAIYLGFVAVIYFLNDAVGRLYDLAIRVSRTNELLVDGDDKRRNRKAS